MEKIDYINQKHQSKKLLKSKLLVCTYPQAAYAECMYSGAPTLLLYDSDIWQTQSICKELLVSLEKNKMLTANEEEAVNHVNQYMMTHSAGGKKQSS